MFKDGRITVYATEGPLLVERYRNTISFLSIFNLLFNLIFHDINLLRSLYIYQLLNNDNENNSAIFPGMLHK